MLFATANAAGYRYGVSDQAFYIPAIQLAMDPAAFPRDASLIDAQGKFLLLDQGIAVLVRLTGLPLDWLFFAGYLLSLGVLWIGIVLVGSRLYRHPATVLALGAAFTLRHRIARTSANTFEPYFHPRMLAFGIGLVAVAALLRRRPWIAVALVALSALVHVTTACWFAALIGIALLILNPAIRRPAILLPALGAVTAAVALATDLLTVSFVTMDDVWLRAVASKDSLFPTEWPLWTWLTNLGLLAVLLVAHRSRLRRGEASPESTALVWGACALVAGFLLTLPLVAARVALPVQLQISRVFWLVDFLATAWLIGEIADTSARRAGAVLVVLALIAGGRGAYVMTVERPDRSLFAIHLADTPWQEAMTWLRRQPDNIQVLADPGHAWKYGTSVRVSAGRDVFLEDQKDSAIAIYSRAVAARVVERAAAVAAFDQLTAEQANALAGGYGIDYLVTMNQMPLPQVYENRQFHIYNLRPTGAAGSGPPGTP